MFLSGLNVLSDDFVRSVAYLKSHSMHIQFNTMAMSGYVLCARHWFMYCELNIFKKLSVSYSKSDGSEKDMIREGNMP